MARQPTSFEKAMLYFLDQKPSPVNIRKQRRTKGYWTDGVNFVLNGHIIAYWAKGAVRMYLTDPRFHSYMIARAITYVKEWCKRERVLAGPHQLICKEHTDCRAHFKLGKACAQRFVTPVNEPLDDSTGSRKRIPEMTRHV
jgi:hypothetical protein